MVAAGEDQLAPESSDLALARLRLGIDQLHLPTPDVPMRVRFQVRNNQLAVVAQTDAGDAEALDAWSNHIDCDRTFSRDSGDRIQRWHVFEPIPDRWADLLTVFELRLATVDPDGTATVVLHGSRQDIREFVEDAAARDIELIGIEGFSPDHPDYLSEEQEMAVRAALEEGYYNVPRKLSLTELADQLGISVSALSERLRRAESQVMALYLGEVDIEPP